MVKTELTSSLISDILKLIIWLLVVYITNRHIHVRVIFVNTPYCLFLQKLNPNVGGFTLFYPNNDNILTHAASQLSKHVTSTELATKIRVQAMQFNTIPHFRPVSVHALNDLLQDIIMYAVSWQVSIFVDFDETVIAAYMVFTLSRM